MGGSRTADKKSEYKRDLDGLRLEERPRYLRPMFISLKSWLPVWVNYRTSLDLFPLFKITLLRK